MILTWVWAATLRARYSSGSMITVSDAERFDDPVALPEVQQMSDSAFTAADELT